jgi:hypothetical protein
MNNAVRVIVIVSLACSSSALAGESKSDKEARWVKQVASDFLHAACSEDPMSVAGLLSPDIKAVMSSNDYSIVRKLTNTTAQRTV